jgi:hypothetical protein
VISPIKNYPRNRVNSKSCVFHLWSLMARGFRRIMCRPALRFPSQKALRQECVGRAWAQRNAEAAETNLNRPRAVRRKAR